MSFLDTFKEAMESKMQKPKIAIFGASGMVGGMFIKILEERVTDCELQLFGSARSAGKTIPYKGIDITIKETSEHIFDKIDYALFAVNGEFSKKYAPIAAAAGCIVIDNSSAWRMTDNVPLIVPEVNATDLAKHKNIIANPNCCAAPAVVALRPLQAVYGLSRVIISTYQSVSGAGVGGMTDLRETQQGNPPAHFPYPIANNIIPHIDKFEDDGYTGEEKKLMAEIKKILHQPHLPITATCVRVPIEYSHSLSINVTLQNEFILQDIQKLLAKSTGIVIGEPYPMPLHAAGTDNVYVGRLRRDESCPNTLNMWVVADNTRKGAATNAIQILEHLMGEI